MCIHSMYIYNSMHGYMLICTPISDCPVALWHSINVFSSLHTLEQMNQIKLSFSRRDRVIWVRSDVCTYLCICMPVYALVCGYIYAGMASLDWPLAGPGFWLIKSRSWANKLNAIHDRIICSHSEPIHVTLPYSCVLVEVLYWSSSPDQYNALITF